MKIKITKSSDWEYEKLSEADTIKDLLKIYPRVVVCMPEDYDKDGKFKDIEAIVEIYDSWRE